MFYEYKCEEHGVFEEVRSMAERDKLTECPKCGQASKRIISTGTIQLEGISGHFPDAAEKWARMHENHGNLKKR
jgi:putative FmdB family regulatory protein